MIAVLAPGQGSQSPGMLASWLELPGATEKVAAWSELTGLDLTRLGTTADAEEIKDTAITQPLIVAASLLAAAELGLSELSEADATVAFAGHSVGELAAAALAGTLTADEAVAFAARRGAEMAAACALTPTGMSAVLGGDPGEVIAAIEAAGLTPANQNGGGQVVAAGGLDALAELAANPPAGARVRPLAVAGAFHTEYMAPAQKALGTYAEGLSAKDPGQLLLSNYDGTAVSSGPDALARLVGQVTRPVRWDLCQATLRDVGVTAILELPPAGTLVGLAKRQLPGVELLAIKSPDDLDRARAMLTSYTVSGAEGGEHTPDFQVVITPIKGVFTRASELVEGTGVARGTRLGTVRTNRDEHPIVAPNAGVLTEWLRHDGDIVAAGLPVARIGSGSDL